MLDAIFTKGLTLGCRSAWVATERSNSAARRLYETAGGIEEECVLVTFRLDGD